MKMKKVVSLLCILLMCIAAQMEAKIVSGQRYRMVCSASKSGCIVLGSRHGAYAYVWNYTGSESDIPADAWWVLTETSLGQYTICNAESGQYMVYVEGRIQDGAGHYLAKGIQLSDHAEGNNALWSFTSGTDGSFVVESVGKPGQYFNLRMDGTGLLGTYGSLGNNGLFFLYDEKGNLVSNVPELPQAANPFSPFIDSLRLDGRELVFDSKDSVLYATLPEAVRGGTDYEVPLYVKYSRPELPDTSGENPDRYSLEISGTRRIGEDRLQFPSVSCQRDYTVTLSDAEGKVLKKLPLRFSFLPLVEVYVSGCNSANYTRGSIRLSDAAVDSVYMGFASFRYRGASSLSYAKKNYAVKLCDSVGNSLDQDFFGLRNDNNWVLDAMTIDKACMRNRVSTDLWNDFSTKPYQRREGWEPKARSGTRGRFVEVFLNGNYHGLYCMTEKIDRKQLRLKKYVPRTEQPDTIHGVLYKAGQWCNEVNMTLGVTPSSYNNERRSESWTGFEVKYPDWEDERIDWGPLWNAINFVANSSDAEFAKNIGTRFDLPVWVDYQLLLELIHASDNTGKNMYYYAYDVLDGKYGPMLGVGVWDMDCSWGRNWDGGDRYTSYDDTFESFNKLGLLTRLARIPSLFWDMSLTDRYAELRRGEFALDKLVKRFTDYRDLFVESGADLREQARWKQYHTDLSGDVDRIVDWTRMRLGYMDSLYGYDPETDGIVSPASSGADVEIAAGKGLIRFYSPRACVVDVYGMDGVLLRKVRLEASVTRVESFRPGLYVVAGKKVAVGR